MKTQIPIYRAKKIDSDEYVHGYVWKSSESEQYFIAQKCDLMNILVHIRVDPSTLAIHFPFYFIDGLYFGLENGKGASIVEAVFNDNDGILFKGYAICNSNGYVFYDKNDDWVSISNLRDIKVTGIQE